MGDDDEGPVDDDRVAAAQPTAAELHDRQRSWLDQLDDPDPAEQALRDRIRADIDAELTPTQQLERWWKAGLLGGSPAPAVHVGAPDDPEVKQLLAELPPGGVLVIPPELSITDSPRRPCMAPTTGTDRCANTLWPAPVDAVGYDWVCADDHRWRGKGRVLRSVPPRQHRTLVEGWTITWPDPSPRIAVVPGAVREAIAAGRCPACHHSLHVTGGCAAGDGVTDGCACTVDAVSGDLTAPSCQPLTVHYDVDRLPPHTADELRIALGLDEAPGDDQLGDVIGLRPQLDTAAWQRDTSARAHELFASLRAGDLDRLAAVVGWPAEDLDADLEGPFDLDETACGLPAVVRVAGIVAGLVVGAAVGWWLAGRD